LRNPVRGESGEKLVEVLPLLAEIVGWGFDFQLRATSFQQRVLDESIRKPSVQLIELMV
jgi:hypothetical protein